MKTLILDPSVLKKGLYTVFKSALHQPSSSSPSSSSTLGKGQKKETTATNRSVVKPLKFRF